MTSLRKRSVKFAQRVFQILTILSLHVAMIRYIIIRKIMWTCTSRCKLKYYGSHAHVGVFVSPAPPNICWT